MLVLPAWFSAVNAMHGPAARHAAYPVVDARGVPVGVVGPEALTAAELGGRTFGEVCRPLSSLPVVRPDDNIDRLIDLPGVADGIGALVIEDNRLVGMVSRGYLLRLSRAREAMSGTRPIPA
jgi:CBS domain-containing protein